MERFVFLACVGCLPPITRRVVRRRAPTSETSNQHDLLTCAFTCARVFLSVCWWWPSHSTWWTSHCVNAYIWTERRMTEYICVNSGKDWQDTQNTRFVLHCSVVQFQCKKKKTPKQCNVCTANRTFLALSKLQFHCKKCTDSAQIRRIAKRRMLILLWQRHLPGRLILQCALPKKAMTRKIHSWSTFLTVEV